MKNLLFIIGVIILIIVGFYFFKSGNSTVQHLANSINYANQATQIINTGNPFEQVDQADIQTVLEFNKKALEEAKLVDIENLNRDYKDFGNHYRDEFIRGLELFIDGFEISDNQKILEGQILLDKWGTWYSQNIEEIKKL